MNPSSNTGHRQRLRSKFLKSGTDSLHDYELLELLLTYAIPRRDVKPIAKELLNKFDNIQGVFDAPIDQLTAMDGIGENVASLIYLIKGLGAKYLEDKAKDYHFLSNISDAIKFVRMKIGGDSKETFMIIYLGSQNQMLNYDCFASGTIDRTNVYRREIVELCLKNRAVSIILGHNHPSGFCTPSPEDLLVTKNIKQALKLIDVRVHDHIIVSSMSSYSMASKKDLEKL